MISEALIILFIIRIIRIALCCGWLRSAGGDDLCNGLDGLGPRLRHEMMFVNNAVAPVCQIFGTVGAFAVLVCVMKIQIRAKHRWLSC